MGYTKIVWVIPWLPAPPSLDEEKIYVDDIAFFEMVFGVPPSLFEHIKLCKSVKKMGYTKG